MPTLERFFALNQRDIEIDDLSDIKLSEIHETELRDAAAQIAKLKILPPKDKNEFKQILKTMSDALKFRPEEVELLSSTLVTTIVNEPAAFTALTDLSFAPSLNHLRKLSQFFDIKLAQAEVEPDVQIVESDGDDSDDENEEEVSPSERVFPSPR